MTSIILAALLSVSADGWYSVMVPDFHMADFRFLDSQGFDVEAVFDSRARVYVNDDGFQNLRLMGYEPVVLEVPVPLVPYPSITEINAELASIVSNHPDICRLENLGTSVQGRPIYAVVVTQYPSQNLPGPRVRIQSNMHGDEKGSGMAALHFLTVLTDNYGTSDMCTYLVNNAETWVIPVLNPDGYNSNSRYNANSVDLNRNCSYMWQSGGGSGPSAFSEPETQALRNITQPGWPSLDNLRNVFAGGLSGHDGATCVNTVWNYSGSVPIQDIDLVTAQAQAYAWHPSITAYYGAGVWDIWIPGASWYPTRGDVNDWSYGEIGTVDHTIEYSDVKSPADWPGVSSANYMPMLEWAISATYGIKGTVIGGGDPLDALIEISIPDGFDSTPLRFTRSDVINGGYSKSLLPGTYNVTATVDGVGTQTIAGIVVGASETVEVNFDFSTGIEGGEPGVHPFFGITATPNPVRGTCDLILTGQGLEGMLSVYDITGRLVYEVNTPGESGVYTWNTGGRVPAGVYVVVYTSGGETASTRLVVAE
jgi:hypothetical protein